MFKGVPLSKGNSSLKNIQGPTISHSEGQYRMENYKTKTMSCLMSTVETELFMPKILQHHFPEEQKLVTVLLSYTTRSNLQNHLYAQTVSKRVILKRDAPTKKLACSIKPVITKRGILVALQKQKLHTKV